MLNLDKFPTSTDSKYSLENFFEFSRDFLCVAGYDGFFKKVNPAFINLLGYTEDELFSKPISEFIFEKDRQVTSENRNNLKKNIPLLNFENRYLSKNGEVIWLSWTSIPEPENQVIYAIAKDITHIKSNEKERNLLLSKFTKANADLKQLSYTTSHDLRAPINNVLSIIDLLEPAKISNPEILEYIELLKTSAITLKTTIDKQVDVLSVNDSSMVIVEQLPLHQILNNTLSSIRNLINNSKAEISVDFSEFEYLKFNASYLQSIFLNLISNSIKYSRPGITPKIDIKSRIKGNCKQLIFIDNGLGFDMELVKDRIFGLHQKFHEHMDSKGIGLYLVYNHITSLGGKIKVDSIINHGTTFTLSFIE